MAEGFTPYESEGQGGPKLRHSTPKTRKNKDDCQLCTVRSKTLPMIQCDSCDSWFHFRCVGLVSFDESQMWICIECKKYNENYEKKPSDICTICGKKNDNKTIGCTGCGVNYHTACLAFEDDFVPPNWLCDVCRIQRVNSSKAKSKASSTNSKAAREIEMLSAIKTLKDKAAVEKMNVEKNFIKDQYDRDVEYVMSKFSALGEMDSDDDTHETMTNQDERSAVDFLNTIRTRNWISRSMHQRTGQSQLSLQLQAETATDQLSEPRSNASVTLRVNNQVTSLQQPTQPHHNQHWFGATNDDNQITRLQLSARQALSKDLPNFYGDAEDWPVFISAFENSTKTCGYRNDENLIRLQKCLKGDAKKAVMNYLTFPDGVPRVIDTLRMLFGNKEKIFYSLLTKIRKHPSPKADDLMSLVDYALSIQNLCGIIEAAKMEGDMNNSLLIQELVEKLPSQIKLNWGIHRTNLQDVTVKNLSDWLYELAKGACIVTTSRIRSRQEKEETKSRSEEPSRGNRTNVNVHQSSPSRSETSNPSGGNSFVETKCPLCTAMSHGLNDCPDFKRMPSEQRWLTVKNNGLCRFCLGPHFYLKCKQRTVCGIDGCEYKHHPKLHRTDVSSPTPKKTFDKTDRGDAKNNLVSKFHHVHLDPSPTAMLRYILVRLYYGNETLQVVIFFDDGATSTLVNSGIVKRLGIEGGTREDILLKWTKGISRIEENCQRVTIGISGIAPGSRRYELRNIIAVDNLELEKQSLDTERLAREYHHLRNIPAYSYHNAAAQMIIGLDNWKLGIPLKVVDRGWTDPVATKTRLGWEIHGEKFPTASVNVNKHTKMLEYGDSDDKLHEMVQEFFSLENFGVKILENSLDSKANIRSKDILNSTMKNIGDRYEVGLLWKFDTISLPDSLPMAVNRFSNFQRQLKSKPHLRENLMKQMEGYVEKGYVKKLSSNEISTRTDRTWYLPIFPSFHPKKPDKVRLVWDAAAKVGGISLNSMLLQGPDNYTNLVDILRRFRERRVPLLADIREWYHQILLVEQDQDSQRFLWPSNDGQSEFDTYKLKVLSFGAACSPSTATEVKNVHAAQYEEKSPRAVKAITQNHYVDDWLDSFDTEDEAIAIGREVKYIHSKAGFDIRNWISSSSNVVKALDGDPEKSTAALNCDFENQIERVLGMWWCVESDTFTFSLKYNPVDREILTGKRAPTKREMLRTLMTIYDPLGFLASFLVYVKILLQDTWRSSIGWDEQIPSDMFQRWKTWVALLPTIEKIRIPRHYSLKIRADNETSIQLHVFVDASELAYTAVAYLRIEDKDGIDVSLVGGKTKTAPLKPISIPKLELQSFVLGVRFSNSIMQGLEISINQRFVWTDSSTVIRWLRSDHRKYNQFVGARIGEILESSKSSEWFWIPRKLNVADDATRWRTIPDLNVTSRWFQGPEFLKEGPSYWPKPTFDVHTEPAVELRKCFVGVHSHHVNQRRWIDVDVTRFSKYAKLIRVMILVRKFVNKLLKRIRPETVVNVLTTQEEYQQAEVELFQRAQYDVYMDEIITLKSGQKYVDRSSRLYKESPYLDPNGVLRMYGRLDAAECIPFDAKRPIILPIDHHITKLIVMDYHERYKHQNHHTVLNEIRQRFLIHRLTVFLKNSVPKLCQFCKNKRAVPRPPQMADLPHARLQAFTRPFSYVGIDYAGPFYVTMFNRVVKRWIVLITCLVVRAIHIEISSSLDTDSCIMCIRNFINFRGTPIEIFSDNGTNFVGTKNELTDELEKLDHNKLHNEFTSCYTKWHFNPPTASHMGGVWERLVRSVKTTLYAVKPHRTPNDELFRCWLMEVMNIVNSRPLTFVPLESDCGEALTPNHFVLGSSNGIKPPGIFTKEGLILRRNWRIAQQLADDFWQKWIVEYLPIIARRSKWFEEVKPIEVGDIVLLVEEENVRNSWPKGRIIEVFTDPKTGQVRSVMVKTNRNIYKRPVHKIAVLDISRPPEVVESRP